MRFNENLTYFEISEKSISKVKSFTSGDPSRLFKVTLVFDFLSTEGMVTAVIGCEGDETLEMGHENSATISI